MFNTTNLDDLQFSFLIRFFATEPGERFFLTGGTALAAFYLQHRISVDLDLFTLDDLALTETDSLIPQIASDLNCSVSRARRSEHFRQYLLECANGQFLQVDLVRDFGPQYGTRKQVGSIIVDSMENIGANKITAVLGRTEPKDFVDLYFILKTGYNFDELLAKAQEKDLGMQPFYLAGSLLQVRNLHHLPATTPPITQAKLEEFIVGLANLLLDRLKPSK